MRSRRLVLLAFFLACGWWGGSRPAWAEDVEAIIKHGVELRRAGRDQEALEQFRRANELAPSPRTLAQIGLAEQALGRWPDAEQDITRALASDQGPRDPWIEKNRATLEKSLADIGEHVGSLEILGEPAGAEVVTDGRVAGKLPLARPIRVTAGSVVIEIRAPEHLPVTRTVTVVAGQLTRETVTLLRAPVATVASAQAGAAASGEPPRITTTLPPQHEPGAAARPLPRTLAWVALAAGSASAVAGVASLIIREVDARNYNANCVHPNAFLTNQQVAQCNDWRSGGSTASNVAVATLIAAGVLGATSATLFYLDARRKPADAIALACAPDVVPWGLGCVARF